MACLSRELKRGSLVQRVVYDKAFVLFRDKEGRELEEARDEDSYDWLVKAELASRDEAAELEDRLRGESLPVHRRWRYVTVDVLTEEQANELGTRLRQEAPEAEVWIEANPDDIPSPTFVLLESRL